jgi:hypothetical protein
MVTKIERWTRVTEQDRALLATMLEAEWHWSAAIMRDPTLADRLAELMIVRCPEWGYAQEALAEGLRHDVAEALAAAVQTR